MSSQDRFPTLVGPAGRVKAPRLGEETAEVMITVKTYPNPSETYGETVCVAGVRLDWDCPEWIRLYTVKFRNADFDSKFKKYEIIRMNGTYHQSNDNRPESFRPRQDEMVHVERLDSKKNWSLRRNRLGSLIGESGRPRNTAAPPRRRPATRTRGPARRSPRWCRGCRGTGAGLRFTGTEPGAVVLRVAQGAVVDVADAHSGERLGQLRLRQTRLPAQRSQTPVHQHAHVLPEQLDNEIADGLPLVADAHQGPPGGDVRGGGVVRSSHGVPRVHHRQRRRAVTPRVRDGTVAWSSGARAQAPHEPGTAGWIGRERGGRCPTGDTLPACER